MQIPGQNVHFCTVAGQNRTVLSLNNVISLEKAPLKKTYTPGLLTDKPNRHDN